MTDVERRRFESIETLRRASYDSFNDRRSYEWKLSLSIWTALALLIAGLVQPAKPDEVFPLSAPWSWVGGLVAAMLLLFFHGYWSNGAARVNSIDRDAFLHFYQAMQTLLKLPFDATLQNAIKALPRKQGWKQWSHVVQLLITALLAATAVVIVYVRSA